jgi:hypothetical protein
MKVSRDINERGGASRGSTSRSYEGVGKNPSAYPFIERPFRPALRGDGLLFERLAGECAGLG